VNLEDMLEKLEILLITYNRAEYLERTLRQLQNSPFSACKITLLDNCSTDDTPQVYRRLGEALPQMKVVRHPKNIGACANYLRAVELSQSLYTWILCDDDLFDFSDCDDVLEALHCEEFDLISLGSPGQLAWERGLKTTSRGLIERGSPYFGVFTFVPGVIFKTALFDSECMAKGYRNIINSFPHYEFVSKSAREDFSVYVSQREIVQRDAHGSLPGRLHHLRVWVNSATTIEDPALRALVIDRTVPTRWGWLKYLGVAIVKEKLQHPKRVFRQVSELALGLNPFQRWMLFFLSPLVLLPAPAYQLAYRLWHAAKGAKSKPDPDTGKKFDFFRL